MKKLLFASAIALCGASPVSDAISSVVVVAKKISPFDRSYPNSKDTYYEYLRPFYNYFYPDSFGHGSGFIISETGLIVTNEHVVGRGTEFVVAVNRKKRQLYPVKVVGKDARTDIALLQIIDGDKETFPALRFADPHRVKEGDPCFLIGTPMMTKLASTVTRGNISALDRNGLHYKPIEGYIQTDVAANPGNAGGPLVNKEGEVIGVEAWGFGSYGYEGLNFAINGGIAKRIVEQLKAHGKIKQGFLGVEVSIDHPKAFDYYRFIPCDGAVVTKVIADSPAEAAGIQEGDILVQLDKMPIHSAYTLRNEVCTREPQVSIDLQVVRGEETISLTVPLGSEELAKKHASTYTFNSHITL